MLKQIEVFQCLSILHIVILTHLYKEINFVLYFVYFSLANKQDLRGAMDDIDIVQAMGLEDLVNINKCPCRVVSRFQFRVWFIHILEHV